MAKAASDTVISDGLGEHIAEGLSDGTYLFETAAKLVKSSNPSKRVAVHPGTGKERNGVFFVITYVVMDEESNLYGDDSLKEWFELFTDIGDADFELLEPEERRLVREQIRLRKERFRSLAIPEDSLNSFSEKGLSNIRLKGTVRISKSNDGKRVFTNLVGVKLDEEVEDNWLDS